MHQREIPAVYGTVQTGRPVLAAPELVGQCRTLLDALWLSMHPRTTGRSGLSHTHYAECMGEPKDTFSRRLNGRTHIPHDWLTRLALATGNLLPLQFLAAQVGMELQPAPTERESLLARLAELDAEQKTGVISGLSAR